MPVTLPPVTIIRRDSSFIFRPSGARSSWAIQVEARQGGVEALAQLRAHLLLHHLGAGEQAQPQAQGFGVFAVGARFDVHGILCLS